MHIYNGPLGDVEELVIEKQDTDTGLTAQLIVYNDDFNTFEWVIKSFMEVISHTAEQSEQLAMIIHFKGKATVKTAPKSVLKPLKDGLVDRGLSAVIEEFTT